MLRNLVKDIYTTNRLVVAFGEQSVRWARKPYWLPKARSKIFKIPPRTKCPKNEEEELKRLNNIYRTEMKSIRAFLQEQTNKSSTGVEVIAEQLRKEQEDLKNCLEYNDNWNAEIAVEREKILGKEKEDEFEQILIELQNSEAQKEEEKRRVEEIVRLEKEKSKFYITINNIDDAIENSINNPVDYNFSIDSEGNKYEGRHTKPPTPNKLFDLDKLTATS